jgi:hypothetical protein
MWLFEYHILHNFRKIKKKKEKVFIFAEHLEKVCGYSNPYPLHIVSDTFFFYRETDFSVVVFLIVKTCYMVVFYNII